MVVTDVKRACVQIENIISVYGRLASLDSAGCERVSVRSARAEDRIAGAIVSLRRQRFCPLLGPLLALAPDRPAHFAQGARQAGSPRAGRSQASRIWRLGSSTGISRWMGRCP